MTPEDEEVEELVGQYIEKAVAEKQKLKTMSTPDELIAAYIQIDNWVDAEQHRFDAHLKPHREKLEAIKNELQARMIEEGVTSYKTPHGTAYQSTIVSPTIEGDKTEFMDWCLEDWNARGEMLQIGAPQKAALQAYVEANKEPPPMVKIATIIRVNIKRG